MPGCGRAEGPMPGRLSRCCFIGRPWEWAWNLCFNVTRRSSQFVSKWPIFVIYERYFFCAVCCWHPCLPPSPQFFLFARRAVNAQSNYFVSRTFFFKIKCFFCLKTAKPKDEKGQNCSFSPAAGTSCAEAKTEWVVTLNCSEIRALYHIQLHTEENKQIVAFEITFLRCDALFCCTANSPAQK